MALARHCLRDSDSWIMASNADCSITRQILVKHGSSKICPPSMTPKGRRGYDPETVAVFLPPLFHVASPCFHPNPAAVVPRCLLRKMPEFSQRNVIARPFLRGAAKNDVVEHLYLQHLPRPDEIARHLDVD